MELTILWAVLTGIAAAWVGLRVFNERLPERPIDQLITAAIVGLVVGRVTAMLSAGVNPMTHLGDFIIFRGGVATAAATMGFVLTLTWSTRDSPSALDGLAPAVLLALAGWHAGCVWRGTCLGTPSDLPWAWAQTGSVVTRHPVEIYAALGLALGAFLVSKIGWRPWARAGAALAAAAGIRLLTEPLRPSITGGPVAWYLAGLAVAALALVIGRGRVTARST